MFFGISIAIAAAMSLLYTFYGLKEGSATGIQPFVYLLTIGFPLMVFVDPIRDAKHS